VDLIHFYNIITYFCQKDLCTFVIIECNSSEMSPKFQYLFFHTNNFKWNMKKVLNIH